MRKYLIAIACLLLFTVAASAQQGSLIQQSVTRLDAGTNVAIGTNFSTVNAQAVDTITVPSGLFAYITGISFDICGDATGTVATNVNFTSSGIVGSPTWAYSASAANTAGTCSRVAEDYATPLKSATPGTNVVITSPTALLHTAFGIRVFYYLGL